MELKPATSAPVPPTFHKLASVVRVHSPSPSPPSSSPPKVSSLSTHQIPLCRGTRGLVADRPVACESSPTGYSSTGKLEIFFIYCYLFFIFFYFIIFFCCCCCFWDLML